MASSANSTAKSKRQKFQNKESIRSSSDRISNLPEHLLSQILSALPTKNSVATSILSKRWRFLWTSITNLDFSDYNLKTSAKEEMQTLNNFINYVNRVLLLLNQPSVHKFSLTFHQFSDIFHINTWICAAVGRNIRDLELNLSTFSQQPVELPMSLFDCKTLEVLKLTEGVVFNIRKAFSVCFPNLKVLHLDSVMCGEIPIEGSVCFPVLKILHLVKVKYVENDDSVSKLMRKCPVLEDLLIRRIYDDNVSKIDMCAPALRSVEICFHFCTVCCKVQIDAPALQYLKIVNWNAFQEFLIKEPYSLIEAKLINTYAVEASSRERRYNVFKLIKAVDKLKFLSLSGVMVKAIKAVIGIVFPLFCNLTQLDMAVYRCDFSVLQSFLQNSIKLQHLVIKEEGLQSCRIEETCWTQDARVPKCLHSALKKVEIHNVVGCTHDIALIEYMLKNAKILGKLTMKSYKLYGDKYYTLLQKIAMFPRGSAACVVEFS